MYWVQKYKIVAFLILEIGSASESAPIIYFHLFIYLFFYSCTRDA